LRSDFLIGLSSGCFPPFSSPYTGLGAGVKEGLKSSGSPIFEVYYRYAREVNFFPTPERRKYQKIIRRQRRRVFRAACIRRFKSSIQDDSNKPREWRVRVTRSRVIK
jgi:hypothetical protein